MARETFWDQRYSDEVYHFGETPNAFLVREAHRLTPGQRVLAVADGEGRNGVFLAGQGLVVESIDASSVGLAKAQRLAKRRGVALTIRVVDLVDFEWPAETYDAIVAIFIQFAGPDLRAAMFSGFARTLKPGGQLLLEGYRTEQLAYGTGGPPQVEHLYTEALLRKAFAGFEIVSLDAYDAPIEEGRGHAGMSALIDLVARKPG